MGPRMKNVFAEVLKHNSTAHSIRKGLADRFPLRQCCTARISNGDTAAPANGHRNPHSLLILLQRRAKIGNAKRRGTGIEREYHPLVFLGGGRGNGEQGTIMQTTHSL